jgi:polyhydroxyalkanoate synthase
MNTAIIAAANPGMSPAEQAATALDRHVQAAMAKMNSGLSPISLALAYTDWALHLMTSPGTQMRLGKQAQEKAMELLKHEMKARLPGTKQGVEKDDPDAIDEALATDNRFADAAWKQAPWSSLAAGNKALELWWQGACNLRGMSDHSREQMSFYTRQMLDMMSPSNWVASNPQVLKKAIQTAGGSLWQGAQRAVEEVRLRHGQEPLHSRAEDAHVGAGLAMTPGHVVMKNGLIELIQYTPTTRRVRREPVLIIPSCIMKYYILDLSPHNSMVKWLVSQGHTVFIVSWRNPDEGDALLGMDDYVRSGVLDALDFVRRECGQPVHLTGYCLGGTFAAMAAAAVEKGTATVAGKGRALASLTLMAAETDFTEPGEMGVLIDEAQVEMLEAMMAEKGFLTGQQMAGSFQFLHSRDLVWSNRTRTLLLGEPAFTNDLMVWNADVTRLPAVMHSQYLRRMYLANELAEGRYEFEGTPLSLHDIRVPTFVVGTVKDHVSPWRSVFKVQRLVGGEVTFVLTNGGHNAGIVSEPGHAGRRFQIQTTGAQQPRQTPDEWLKAAPQQEGSWWTAWQSWLVKQGSPQQIPARTVARNKSLGPAPGENVKVCYAD